MTSPPIDQSVYPDVTPPEALENDLERAEYVERIACAFDFGIAPEPDTIALLRDWRDIFDRFPLRASPAYHAFRSLFGWPPVEALPYLGTPPYLVLDRLEGRVDGCEHLV